MLSRQRSLTDDREFRRCRVFHVAPLTFAFGFAKVIFHASLFVLICTLLMKPDLLDQHENHNKVFGCICKHRFAKDHQIINNQQVIKKHETNDVALFLEIKSFQEKEMKHNLGVNEKIDKRLTKERRISQLYWALLMTSFYLLFSVMLLHGILNKNAPNMLPFFCLQLFDFVLDFLWLFGHLLSTRNLHKLEVEFKCLPLGKYLNNMDPAMASFMIFLVCSMVLMFQLYIIGVVWSCYRYIVLSRCQVLPLTNSAGSSPRSGGSRNPLRNGFWGLELWQVILSPKDRRLKKLPKEMDNGQVEELPNYEEVLNTPINTFNPPPYVEKTTKENEKEKEAMEKK